MAWNMTPVDAPASSVKTPLADIPDEVRESVEEGFAFCQQSPGKRLVVPFGSDDEAARARVLIRSYCEQRPAGRLTASMWGGWVMYNESGEVAGFTTQETPKATVPGLSVLLRAYVRKVPRRTVSNTSANGAV